MLLLALLVSTALIDAQPRLQDLEAELAGRSVARPGHAHARPDQVDVVDADGLGHDRQIALLTLQGLVNRTAPRLFIVGMSDFNRKADLWWVERLEGQYGIEPHQLTFAAALSRYAPELNGAVVYSPDEPNSENTACMLAALLNLLPVTPEMRPVADEHGLPIVGDIRGAHSDRVEANQWAIDHLMPRLAPRDIACLDDGAWFLIRDYAVMRGAFMTDLSTSPILPDESKLRGAILDALPPDSIQWGWVIRDSEHEHVKHGSEHGVRTLCSTNSPNLSYLSQIRPLRARLPRRPKPDIPTLEDKVYLSFVLSDGDSIPILLTRQWYRWDEDARGTIPFGWELQPLMQRIAPIVQEYYYETASSLDEFIVGPSGAGYVHPSSLPDPTSFMADTNAATRELGATVVGILDGEHPLDESAELVGAGIPNATGFFYGWGGSPSTRPTIVGRKPHMAYRLCPPDPNGAKDDAYYAAVAHEIRRIARMDGLPCCIPAHLSCYWSGPDDVPRIMEALGPDFPAEVVLPGALAELAARAYRSRVFMSAPATATAAAGMPFYLPTSLTNTGSRRVQAEVTVEAEHISTSIRATTVRIPPQAEITRNITLRAPDVGDEAAVHFSVAARGRALEQTVSIRVVAPPTGLPPGEWGVYTIWEAEDLSHSNGSAVDDPAAYNEQAWGAFEEADKGEGVDTATVWGPYEQLTPGTYAVAFRLRNASQHEGILAKIDCFDFYAMKAGGNSYLAQQDVYGSDLPSDNSYADVWLDFEIAEPRKCEYRVWWQDKGSVVVDRVVILKQLG